MSKLLPDVFAIIEKIDQKEAIELAVKPGMDDIIAEWDDKDEDGNVVEVLATYDPDSRGGDPADGRKIKGATLHWVDAETCVEAEVRQYSNLFDDPDPDAAGKDFLSCLNPNSLEVLSGCKLEASLADAKAPASFQFMRLGYFCPDSKDSTPDHLVFNRSVSLKDSYKPQ